jgi:hypothetical protein
MQLLEASILDNEDVIRIYYPQGPVVNFVLETDEDIVIATIPVSRLLQRSAKDFVRDWQTVVAAAIIKQADESVYPEADDRAHAHQMILARAEKIEFRSPTRYPTIPTTAVLGFCQLLATNSSEFMELNLRVGLGKVFHGRPDLKPQQSPQRITGAASQDPSNVKGKHNMDLDVTSPLKRTSNVKGKEERKEMDVASPPRRKSVVPSMTQTTQSKAPTAQRTASTITPDKLPAGRGPTREALRRPKSTVGLNSSALSLFSGRMHNESNHPQQADARSSVGHKDNGSDVRSVCSKTYSNDEVRRLVERFKSNAALQKR